MEQWYVLQTHFAQENRAEAHLRNQGVECWLPMMRELTMKDGALRPVKPQALFPRYIFARFDPEVIHTTTIKATRGVSTIVSFGGRQAVLPDGVIARLQHREGLVREPEKKPAHGETVEITAGAFEGLEAVWHEPKGDGRAMLLLNLMGRLVEVSLRGHRDLRFHRIAQQSAA